MRKLFLVVAVMLSGFAFAQPIINTPTPLQVCDDGLSGFGTFNLQSKIPEILGTLNAADHTVRFYLTQADADAGLITNQIVSPFNNSIPFTHIVFVRVTEIATSLYAVTSLDLVVNPTPQITPPLNMTVVDSLPFDGVATFDLTSRIPMMMPSTAGFIFNFYLTLSDAQASINMIAGSSAYINITNPQTIYVRAQNVITGCFATTSFNLIVLDTNAIVYIPDANFKAKLLSSSVSNFVASDLSGNYFKIDANNDNEIQVTEAYNIKLINVNSSNVSSLTGIEYFYNLNNLFCQSNQITTIDLSNLTLISSLYCGSNQITSINFGYNTGLSSIYCPFNQLTTLNLLGLSNLSLLNCSNNMLTSLNVNANNLLSNLQCDSNQLTSLNLMNNVALTSLNCYNNQLMSLNVSNNIALSILFCGNNQLTNLNVNNNIALSELQCSFNQLSSLNVSNNPELNTLLCAYNQLTSLNVTNTTLLTDLNFNENPFLQTLLIKNGQNNFNTAPPYILSGCPNLTYICADTDETQTFLLNNSSYTGVINSYCSFTPGGNYNTITGTTNFDSNNNGCDNSDPVFQNQRIDIADGTNAGATFANNLGNYIFYVQQPNLTLTPYLENPSYFTVTPPTANFNFPTNNNSTQTQDFCINANGIHNDLEIVIAPIGVARPGFDVQYQLVYKNKGNQTLSGTINLTFDDAKTDFVSALPTVDSQTVNNLSWNYANLLPFESRVISVVLNLNSPLETPAVNSGDVLNFTTTINPIVADELPLDNAFDFLQTVVNSFDPNIITCLEGDSLPPTAIGKYVHYAVQFENTGTASAVNVVVNDVIDATKYDISTLQVLNSSNNVRTDINNNTVEFIFQNINLAAVAGSPPVGGHGDVLFKIKTKSSLTAGDNVLNKAKIFFDYNAPIITNDAVTTFAILKNSVFVTDNSVSMSPNPATSKINVISNSTVKFIEVYDVQGRILETVLNANSIDISDKSNGIYFLKITTDYGSKIEKVVKE
jgi:uncharacterized repeat protein (TIGR01451 family)